MPGREALGGALPHPLQLRQYSSLLTRAATVVLQRGPGLQIPLGAQVWTLEVSLVHAGSGRPDLPWTDRATPWVMDLMWGGAAYQLVWPEEAPAAWMESLIPGTRWPVLPDALAHTLIEAVSQRILRHADSEPGTEARLLRIQKTQAVTHAQEVIWQVALKAGTTRIDGWLLTGEPGVIYLATRLRGRPPGRGPLQISALPLQLHAQLGFSWLTLADLQRLCEGDVLIVQRPLLAPDGELWWTCGTEGVRARPVAGQGWVVTHPWQPGGWGMHPDDPDDGGTGLGPASALQHLPLRVTFDIGSLQLSVGELAQLQPGQALDLQRPLSEAVHLRVNGVRIGLGEMVNIDGRMGVVVRALHANALSPDLVTPEPGAMGQGPDNPAAADASTLDRLPDLPPQEA